MKRRSFLRHTCHSLAIPGLMSSFGFSSPKNLSSFLRTAMQTDKVLVLIYLQGGNDGLNTVVPLDQLSALDKVRKNVMLPEGRLLRLDGTNVALHSALQGFKSLYTEGRLEIIQSVGYPDQNYSHFRSTDIWMSGSGSDTTINSGWTGRYLSNDYPGFPAGYPNETNPDPLAIELGYGSSLLFQGPASNMSMVLNDPTAFYQLVENVETPAPDTNAGDKLRHVRLTALQSQQYGKVVQKAANLVTHQEPYPDTDLAQQLKVVSRLIAGGLKTSLYLVRIGGFDTHDAQVDASDHTKGEHASLLLQVNDAVMAFMKDLEYHGADDRVIGMTFSEFGRRIASNASLGTDHGSASPLFVFGNKVKGGVLGNNPVILGNTTAQHNLDMQYDFRQVYTSILEQWFGVDESHRTDILMNNFDTIPVIREANTVGISEKVITQSLRVYPNPVVNTSVIQFLSTGQPVYIEAIDMQGRRVTPIFNGTLPAGVQSIPLNLHQLEKGRYFVVLRSNSDVQTASVLK